MENKNIHIKPDEERAGGYVSKLYFDNGQFVDINKGDIVVFVGPNNVGKSQTLRDIYALCEDKKPSVVVNDIDIVKYSGKIEKMLNQISAITDNGSYKNYSGLGFDISSYAINNPAREKYYGALRLAFVAYLDTRNRLTICDPAQLINRKSAKKHPIQCAAFNSGYREWLSSNFKKAFGYDLIPFTQNGANIPLCIGDAVKFNEEFEDEQIRQETYATILESYNQVQDQGDGVKSFTGILLYLMLDYFSTYLIDEPESFLHPPQANIMGQIIGETLKADQQAFISTHSEDIIKGLIEVAPKRVKIVRITRQEDMNSFAVLNNDSLNKVWNDPLLKYSNIMTSLFHKEVILCESDSDCKIYSIIERNIKLEIGQHSETLFIHCSGKHRMAKIIQALRSLDIKVKVIPDIDVLNDQNVFKNITDAVGIEWENICKEYNIIKSNLHSPKETIDRGAFKIFISNLLDSRSNKDLSDSEIKQIYTELHLESKWDSLKKYGISALPHGDATIAFDSLNKKLKCHGIYIVPVGELECFVKKVGGHGPDWVNRLLEEYPDLNDDVYNEIKKFMREVII